jgi:murein DD-endopeptidase MepM/ murein hydrolase activator NlpD
VGAFLAGLRLGLLAVLAIFGASFWWRQTRPGSAGPTMRPATPPRVSLRDPGEPSLPDVGPLPTSDAEIDRLRARSLLVPVEGYDLKRLRDGFREARGARVHNAIDLMAARGTRVRAVDDGVVRKLITSARGGVSIYQLDPEGRYCYYYAHLDRYAPFLAEGKPIRKGEVLGYVGSTGNAPEHAPHLHFAVYRLRDPGRWWDGTALNPYPVWAGG